MNTAINESPPVVEVDGVPMVLPAHLLRSFEKADRKLLEIYGVTPGVPALVRIWLACGTSSLIRREFELAALGIEKAGIHYEEEGEHDGDEI